MSEEQSSQSNLERVVESVEKAREKLSTMSSEEVESLDARSREIIQEGRQLSPITRPCASGSYRGHKRPN